MDNPANMCQSPEPEVLPCNNEIPQPVRLQLPHLQAITDNFSEARVIGHGAFGTVYKGKVGDGFVAVKKFHPFVEIKDETFYREVDCLMRIKHRNIVQFVGYCAYAEERIEVVKGKTIFAESRTKLLCFEYLPNGNLDKHLTDKPCGLQWQICYKIIKGICQGLHYLHDRHIIHLDLKPENILLDANMVPKIADFGISRLLGEGQSRAVTKHVVGTLGYIAQEYFNYGVITAKADIFSLGVVIEKMVNGRQMTGGPTDICYRQLEACNEISRRCKDPNPDNRPAIPEILRWLEDTEAGDRTVEATMPATSAQTRALLKLMGDLQSMVVTFSTGEPSQVEQHLHVTRAQRFWVDSTSGANCYMLSARSLRITWGDTPGHWKWISRHDSRFPECAELLSVYFLAVIGEIPARYLTRDKSYAVYLVYALASGATGLQGVQTSSLRLYGERVLTTSRVSVNPAMHGGASDVVYPATRDDGWMELKLAEFTSDETMLAEEAVIVDFREVNDHVNKSGLVIEGLEFRSTISN